jgi:hypothetical protein
MGVSSIAADAAGEASAVEAESSVELLHAARVRAVATATAAIVSFFIVVLLDLGSAVGVSRSARMDGAY